LGGLVDGWFFRANPILSGFVAWSAFLLNRTKFASLQIALRLVWEFSKQSQIGRMVDGMVFPSKANSERVRCVEWVLPNRTKFASLQQSGFGRVAKFSKQSQAERIGRWDGISEQSQF
jgi:hypothetical protein